MPYPFVFSLVVRRPEAEDAKVICERNWREQHNDYSLFMREDI